MPHILAEGGELNTDYRTSIRENIREHGEAEEWRCFAAILRWRIGVAAAMHVQLGSRTGRQYRRDCANYGTTCEAGNESAKVFHSESNAWNLPKVFTLFTLRNMRVHCVERVSAARLSLQCFWWLLRISSLGHSASIRKQFKWCSCDACNLERLWCGRRHCIGCRCHINMAYEGWSWNDQPDHFYVVERVRFCHCSSL